MKLGYARVSTQDQKLVAQVDALKQFGCELIFEEKISGKDKDRPELNAMLSQLRKDDTVVVWKLDRLGRSLKDLVYLMEIIQRKGSSFVSLQDNIDTTTATGRFTFNLFASLAEFEREIIRERTMLGLLSARSRDRRGGRPKGLSKEAINKAYTAKMLYDQREKSITAICDILRISKSSFYRYLNYVDQLEKSKKSELEQA